ncbi:MAG: hypothetical protein E6R03_00580 [Hyphomicrobiaceae bacterium]|nr:MAG: hypothetical protein E6R03_00580 [Hyphomicrobiaceae bacterium]
MKLLQADIENFLSIGSARVHYDQQGLVLVEGHNCDSETAESNGAGKSSMMTEPIVWGLFGVTSRGISGDQVVHAGVGKNTRVTLSFAIGDTLHVVTRYRKHSKGKNGLVYLRNGEDVSRATAKETQVLIESALGMTQQVFLFTIMLGQGTARRFTQLTDAGRKEVIEGVTGLGVFDEARTAARTEATQASEAVQTTELARDAKLEEIERLEIVRDRQAEAALQLWQSRMRDAEVALEAARTKSVAALSACVATKAELDKVVSDLGVSSATLVKLQEKRDKLSADLSKVDDSLRAPLGDVRTHSAKIGVYQSSLSQVTGAGACPTCRRKITDTARAEIELEFKALIDAAAALRDAAQSKVTDGEARRVEIQAAISDVSNAIRSERDRLLPIQERQKSAQQAYQRARDAASSASTQLEAATHTMASLAKNKPQVDTSIEDQLVKLRARVGSLNTKIDDLRAELGLLTACRKVFDRMRSMSLTDALDYLNTKIAVYTRALTDGSVSARLTSVSEAAKGGAVLDRIGLTVTTAGGDYNSASGGEQDRIDFAIALALRDLVAAARKAKHNVLVIDEPANFVDPVGLRAIVGVLESKLEDNGGIETILLASQNPVLKEMISQSWLVEKRDGTSSLITN